MGIVLRAGAVSLPRDTILSLSGTSVGVGLISDVPSEVGTLVDKPLFGVALSATEPCWVAGASVWLGDALPPMSITGSSVFLHANNPNANKQASRAATILPNFIKLSLIILFFAAL